MHLRFFTLLEQLQKLDDHLRLAQSRSRPDPIEIGHLSARKRTLRQRLAKVMQRSTAQPA
ncbi:uncharacterized protein YdcH (DUF465 family) [Novosphingobium fluoreni]|uniref:Uncharacterized protein YdcH (DUF465 family) n=1 Tax=Novosphingobium fluoreni TaxID=1391222 RepID=A0A7W6C0J0_9SPHN|nr:DUF465 domain-containing protein [Novosphingobium fluoreni]MBB3939905.1 uncharacterized protein YdcH (DUF465 family) [Novosphingobium fluoreni]